MAKESLKPNSPECIFRETFNSEQATRDLGGVPTAVTYLNGVGSCVAASSSYIRYPQLNLKGTYSIRIRVASITPVAASILIDFRGTAGTGTGQIQITSPTLVVSPSNGTVYIDGVASSAALTSSNKEIVVTGMTISGSEIYFNGRYSIQNFGTAGYELVEIYEGTLSASQVALMAKNAQNQNFKSPTINCLICLDSFTGVIKDNTFSNTITPTNTNVVMDGSSYAMNLNGADSKVDCGSDIVGTKSITTCIWVRANSVGETAGRIIDNSKCVLYTTVNSLVFTRDFVSFASPVASSIPFGKYNFVAITSTSTGSSTFYTGNKKVNPIINGGAGQAGGTPAAGTNVIIGNNTGQTRTFDGDIKMVRIFEGILSIEEITQIWSATKYLI